MSFLKVLLCVSIISACLAQGPAASIVGSPSVTTTKAGELTAQQRLSVQIKYARFLELQVAVMAAQAKADKAERDLEEATQKVQKVCTDAGKSLSRDADGDMTCVEKK